MNRREMIAGLAMVGALLAGAYSATASSSVAEAQALVAKAIAHLQEHGAEATIAAVNAGEPFRQGELYVFMISEDGTNVANAADKTNIGKDARNIQDPDGKFYGVEMLERATAEGVWIDYKRFNPANGKVQPKTSWVRKADGFVIGCGIYLND